MNNQDFTYVFKGEELQLIDDLAKEYQCSRSELVSKSILITKETVDGPHPLNCSWDEWFAHFREIYEEALLD